MATYGFYVDTERCIKCWACEVACKQWNKIPAGQHKRRNVYEITAGTFPNVSRTFVSLSCMHCDKPACVNVCPSGALEQRAEDGIVMVDKSKCIGCHYCFYACPFGVPRYTKEGMDKCDCCLGNGVAPGDLPHCVQTCPTKALQYGTYEELGDKLSQATAAGMVSTGTAAPKRAAQAPAPAAPSAAPTTTPGAPALGGKGSGSGGSGAKEASCG